MELKDVIAIRSGMPNILKIRLDGLSQEQLRFQPNGRYFAAIREANSTHKPEPSSLGRT